MRRDVHYDNTFHCEILFTGTPTMKQRGSLSVMAGFCCVHLDSSIATLDVQRQERTRYKSVQTTTFLYLASS